MTGREIKKLAREIEKSVSMSTSGSERIRSMKRHLASLGLPLKPVHVPYKHQKELWAEEKRLRAATVEAGALKRPKRKEERRRKRA
jgi:hypothetical protein